MNAKNKIYLSERYGVRKRGISRSSLSETRKFDSRGGEGLGKNNEGTMKRSMDME
jgi:hypothetical protein